MSNDFGSVPTGVTIGDAGTHNSAANPAFGDVLELSRRNAGVLGVASVERAPHAAHHGDYLLADG